MRTLLIINNVKTYIKLRYFRNLNIYIPSFNLKDKQTFFSFNSTRIVRSEIFLFQFDVMSIMSEIIVQPPTISSHIGVI